MPSFRYKAPIIPFDVQFYRLILKLSLIENGLPRQPFLSIYMFNDRVCEGPLWAKATSS
jgi:hypothetical protein